MAEIYLRDYDDDMSKRIDDQGTSDRSVSAVVPEPAKAGGTLNLLPSFAPLVAPTMLALSGMLYLAGWGYKQTRLERFGISSDMFEFSLQDILATGYIPVLLGTIVAAALMFVVGYIYLKQVRKPKDAYEGWAGRLSRVNDQLTRANGIITMALILLSYGLVAGALMGEASATKISTDVEAGCKDKCFNYVMGTTSITGRMIVQDRTRTAIYSRAGVYVVKNDAITRVIPLKRVSRTGLSARDVLPW